VFLEQYFIVVWKHFFQKYLS